MDLVFTYVKGRRAFVVPEFRVPNHGHVMRNNVLTDIDYPWDLTHPKDFRLSKAKRYAFNACFVIPEEPIVFII